MKGSIPCSRSAKPDESTPDPHIILTEKRILMLRRPHVVYWRYSFKLVKRPVHTHCFVSSPSALHISLSISCFPFLPHCLACFHLSVVSSFHKRHICRQPKCLSATQEGPDSINLGFSIYNCTCISCCCVINCLSTYSCLVFTVPMVGLPCVLYTSESSLVKNTYDRNARLTRSSTFFGQRTAILEISPIYASSFNSSSCWELF
jgi:hypothetical protein